MIEQLSVGEAVWSWDPFRAMAVRNTVVAVTASTRSDIVRVRLPGGEVLYSTPEHPFFDSTRGIFRPLGHNGRFSASRWGGLVPGALEPISVDVESIGGDDVIQVFDLSVGSPHHNFFAEGLLVHNKQPVCGWEDRDGDGWTQVDTALCRKYVGEFTDCDDRDPQIEPKRNEVCLNGVDDNCNGLVDECRVRGLSERPWDAGMGTGAAGTGSEE